MQLMYITQSEGLEGRRYVPMVQFEARTMAFGTQFGYTDHLEYVIETTYRITIIKIRKVPYFE